MCYGPRRPLQTGRRLATAACLLLSACVGTIDSPRSWSEAEAELNNAAGLNPDGTPLQPGSVLNNIPGLPGSSSTGGPSAPGGKANGGTATCNVGTAPMRRLTHVEYNNAVHELLGDTTAPATTFAHDNQIGLFNNSAEAQTVPSLLGDQYMNAAVDLAENVNDFRGLMGCDAQATGATGASCVQNFITSFGKRAYRRPLTTEEHGRLFELYNKTRTASDVATGVRSMIVAVLMSPNFLFKPEFGAAPSTFANAKKVSQYEQATRLASLVWASVPDDQLLQAAESDQLSTPAQVEAQARRMLADPKAKPALAAFFEQWLGLSLLEAATKDPAFFPDWSDDLRAAMFEERRRFVSHVLWEDDGRLETLLTANYSFLNAPLAKLYGATAAASGDMFAQTQLDSGQRAGVMTQAAMLATFARPDESSPVKRGKWVRERMLCQDLPAPPALVPQLPAPVEGISNRERFALHTADPACAGCHRLIDGLGFGLEHYDSVGAFRTMGQGVAIDASGTINDTVDIDGMYTGGPELANTLASSEQVRDCVPTQALRYAWGRRETGDDSCAVSAVQDAFAKSDGNLRELIVALTQNDAFTNYRQAN
jgi:hypothetical protein